ncbi:glycosyltransferase family 4 protein [Actibacterium sp. 188UL27-1]|uniref:glycosyltransferase family 4 protein n=1 Tax=Actibacterium sp. 188UL27-1 TaxID=2786961 RepID=UPI0019596898|nr:glycosyltransferase family 4 protein [Actibacterium sp. 188UL27-1]MBM7069099.1 glycosyltransferase family 4 protein [Actibacterium sp. 188UL27-1]
MRILVLAPQPFMTDRGTPIAVKLLLETLSERGDQIDTIVFAEGRDVQIDNCRIIRVPALPGLRNVPPGFSVKKLITDMVMFPMVIWQLLRNRYDLVLAVEEAAYMAMVLKPIFRVPYVFDVDSSIPEQLRDKYALPGWIDRTLTRTEGMAARSAFASITCCAALKDTVQKHAPDLPIQVLEDVTMLSHDQDHAAPAGWNFDDPIIMYVGNLESYQGLDLLLGGFSQIDFDKTPAQLVVIGGSDDHIAEYEQKAQKAGCADRVFFLGPRPVGELGRYLSLSTITASPRTQGRNTPMKIYSYLDSGRPLIATRLPTHTQVLDDDISMLVEPNATDMARGLTALLEDDGLRQRMAQAAQARVAAEFSPDAYRRKLLGFFDTVIEPGLAVRQGQKA